MLEDDVLRYACTYDPGWRQNAPKLSSGLPSAQINFKPFSSIIWHSSSNVQWQIMSNVLDRSNVASTVVSAERFQIISMLIEKIQVLIVL